MIIILASLYSQIDLILPTPNGESPNGVRAVKDYASYVGGFHVGWVLRDQPILHLQATSSSPEHICFLYFAKMTSGPKSDFALVNDLGGTEISHRSITERNRLRSFEPLQERVASRPRPRRRDIRYSNWSEFVTPNRSGARFPIPKFIWHWKFSSLRAHKSGSCIFARGFHLFYFLFHFFIPSTSHHGRRRYSSPS